MWKQRTCAWNRSGTEVVDTLRRRPRCGWTQRPRGPWMPCIGKRARTVAAATWARLSPRGTAPRQGVRRPGRVPLGASPWAPTGSAVRARPRPGAGPPNLGCALVRPSSRAARRRSHAAAPKGPRRRRGARGPRTPPRATRRRDPDPARTPRGPSGPRPTRGRNTGPVGPRRGGPNGRRRRRGRGLRGQSGARPPTNWRAAGEATRRLRGAGAPRGAGCLRRGPRRRGFCDTGPVGSNGAEPGKLWARPPKPPHRAPYPAA